MGVMIGPKSGGKHGYVEETVRERVSREEMTKGWQGEVLIKNRTLGK